MMTQLSDEVVERVGEAIYVAIRTHPTIEYDCCATDLTLAELGDLARAAIAAYEAKGDIPLDEG